MSILFLLSLLLACQPQIQYVPVPQPVYPQSQPQYVPPAQPVAQPQAESVQKIPELGPVDFKIFAYGARDVSGSVNPNTPLEYRIKVMQQAPQNPPITNAYQPTITMVVIYNDGLYEIYGTEDLYGIQPSNVIGYDPSVGSWVNTKGISQGNVKGQQRFVIVITFNGKTKIIQHSVNVR